jgi:16S rRNA (cytosine967-C5)-methyltransferase
LPGASEGTARGRTAAARNTSSNPPAGSLASAMLVAAQAVAAVSEGSALPAALLEAGYKGMPADTRGAAQDLAYRAMRWLGTSEAILREVTARPPEPAQLGALLQVALALLLDPQRPYEPYTVVDQAVEACAANRRIAQAKGMVNAVLRKVLRGQAELLAQARRQGPGRWNYPEWWINEVRQTWPQEWEAILEAGNLRPPMTLRVNQRQGTVDDYLALLAEAGMDARRIGPWAIRLEQPLPVERLPGFGEGRVSVQDAAAQLAAPLLDLAPGQRVLDACAAPGGKTGHILECADVELVAMDLDGERLRRVQDNLDRLKLPARLVQGDAARADWWDGQPFQRILADVPCTASGIVRRHPDIRWLRRPTDAARLAAHSARILDQLWAMLAPGGKMLLVTCSIWPQESSLQAQAFAARHGALVLDAPGQLLPEANPQQDHDGLFYALFQKPPV